MPTDRAGYNLTVFAIDVSTSMRDKVAVGEDGVKRSKLDLAKEYVARSCEPRVSLQPMGDSSVLALVYRVASGSSGAVHGGKWTSGGDPS